MSRTPAYHPPRRVRTYTRHPALQHPAPSDPQQPPQRPRAPRQNQPPRPRPSTRAFEVSHPGLPSSTTTTATASASNTYRQQLTVWDIIEATNASRASARGSSRRPPLTEDQLEVFAASLARVLNSCARAFERLATREAESAMTAVLETMETAELSEMLATLEVAETAAASPAEEYEAGTAMPVPEPAPVPTACEEVFSRQLLWTVVRDCEDIINIMTIGLRYSGFGVLVEANQVTLMMVEQEKCVEARDGGDSE